MEQLEKIAMDIQREWRMGGLASGIYLDFVTEVNKRYVIGLLEKMRERLEGMKVIGMTAEECKCCSARNKSIQDLISYIDEQLKELRK